MADTAAAVTGTDVGSSRAPNAEPVVSDNDRSFDILAFLALYFGSMRDFAQSPQQRVLADTFFDARLLSLATGGGAGGSFAVSVVKSSDMQRLQDKERDVNITDVLPPLIAMRVPKVSTTTEQPLRQRILTAMAKEIEVLTNEEVRSCKNVVKLLGACWSYANPEKNILLPVLVYEAAPLGDLDAFLLTHKDLPLGHQLQLCIDVAQGIERLHRIGVVHCDIKPRNIIVFPTGDPKRPYVAKIADFGCAIMMGDVDDMIRPPPGTRFWNPPEQLEGRLVDKANLERVDLFSLGLVVLTILTSNQSTRTLTFLQDQFPSEVPTRDHRMGFDYFKKWGSLAICSLMLLERFANLTVTQRSSVKADAWERLLPPELLNDENAMDYSTHWNAQVASILFQALQGDIDERNLTARDIASVLESVLVSVEIWGQRDHIRVDLHEVVTASGTRVNMSYILESESRDVMRRAKPHIVQDPDDNKRIASRRDWFLERNPHTNMSYAMRKMAAAMSEDEWEEELFGPERCGKRPWMAVYKRAKSVIKLTNYLGNMSLMPGPLLEYVMRVLEGVAYDPLESKDRRATAAYEYALSMVAYTVDESSEDGDETQILQVLNLLQVALDNGHAECKWVIGWMHETFGHLYPEEQVDWLVEGMIAGSRIAARRLKKLSPLYYSETLRLIRNEYQGIGLGWRILPEYVQRNPLNHAGIPIPESYQLVLAASTGNLADLRRLLDEGTDIDSVDGMRETPLIAACRAGQLEIVDYLVEHGADPSKVSKENISALHFLSSFDDKDIPYLALLLLAAGCTLETNSTGHSNLNNGHTGSDRLYGLVDGTPLLWAVAADNLTAVKTLLDSGADPFDQDGASQSVQYHPVGYAATMHQYEMLVELLAVVPKERLQGLLNPTPRVKFTGSFRGPPLGPACAYSGGLVFYRMQVHGPHHREQCRKTISLLLCLGSDPSRVESSGQPALHYAGIHGQPYALQALLEWPGGIPRPDIRLWANILIGAVHNDRKGSFRELLKMDVQTDSKYSWPAMIGTVAEQLGSNYYVSELISHHQKLCPGSADYTIPFELALQSGNFDNAKTIFQRADKCDIVHRRFQDADDGSSRESMTLLGRLMRQALIYASQLPAVREFMELTGGLEHLFDKVWDVGQGRLNALQVAVMYAGHGKTRTVTTGLLNLMLEYYQDPVRHLSTINDLQQSLLHMAVRHGNAGAVEILLNYNGIDLGHRDNEHLTAFDRALNRLQDSWRDKELQYWEVPEEQLEKAREKWDHDSRVMILAMQKSGASKFSTYSHVFKRISKEKIRRWMIYPDDGRIEVTDFGSATFEAGELTDKVAALPIGRCSYLAAYASPEVTSKIAGGRELNIADLLQRTTLGG